MLVAHIDPSASLFADFLHKIEKKEYNTHGQYENIQNDTEAQRSERTTESGADRKKVKRNGYVKRRTRGKTDPVFNSAGIQQYITADI